MSTLFRGSLAGSLAQELGGEMEVFLQQSGGGGGVPAVAPSPY